MQNKIQYGSGNEDDLVSAARRGDPDAFSELTKRHYDASLKLAMYLLRQREEAEDEVQNAYSRAFQKIALFREEAKFSTWITRIVLNCCLMRLRRSQRVKMRSIEETVPGEQSTGVTLVDGCPGAEADLGHREVMRWLRTELSRIPPLLRNVLELRDIDELPITEVAQRLGISVPAAKSRLLRARQELRIRMERHQNSLGPAALIS